MCNSKRRYLTSTEVERLLVAAKKGKFGVRDYCLLLMCFIHGCRVSELTSLRCSDVDLDEKKIFISRLKNGLSTQQPLCEREYRAIKHWMSSRVDMEGAESDWLFLSSRGTPLSRQQIHRLVRNYGWLAELPVDIHPHMLRHACGFALADQGMDTRLIQDYLGHRNIRHTVHYTASNALRFQKAWKNSKFN